MSVGRVLNSLAATSVENTLSLMQVNVNFDFTSQKTLAPPEYRTIGQALSISRRFNAENGSAHRTARKLGWLFGQVIPSTPELLKAYGRRVSEIVHKPGINPTGSEADGPFREHVGLDYTSLWAAATSGIPSLGVHLLACMLARDWDGPTATAIWVELVERRSLEILHKRLENHNVSDESMTAARQEFSRKELEEWDASARSWLGQADKALTARRDQFLLIVKNVSLSIGDNKDPYTNIIAAWTQAMAAMERHLQGTSQQISDGAILKAISAWHLYPELIHFGSSAKRISFQDPLFTMPAFMTIGMTEVASTEECQGIHWSLALSHLRYYGDAVSIHSVEDRTRATVSQFQVIVLGTVLDSWGVPLDDAQDAIAWIHTFWNYLKNTAPPKPFDIMKSGHTSWLAVLGEAADLILSATGSDVELYQDYMCHGERRGYNFLIEEEKSQNLQPYFGLCNPIVMAALLEPIDIDAGIEFLRQLATNIGLEAHEAIICYSDRRGLQDYFEYCTAVSHLNSAEEKSHARWIIKMSRKDAPSARLGRVCPHVCHSYKGEAHLAFTMDLEGRSSMIRSRDEACFVLDERDLYDRLSPSSREGKNFQQLVWEHSPPLYWTENQRPSSICQENTICKCLTPTVVSESVRTLNLEVTFESVLGNGSVLAGGVPDAFQLYIRSSSEFLRKERLGMKVEATANLKVNPSEGRTWFESGSPQPNRVWDYLQSLTIPVGWVQSHQILMQESVPTPAGFDWQVSHSRAANLISKVVKPPPRTWIRSLELINVASEIYRGLPGATISLDVLLYPISGAYWTVLDSVAPVEDVTPRLKCENLFGAGELIQQMGRQEIFSCIALMETGRSNIKPEALKEVMAMSFNNSIFVGGSLLSDPHELVPAKNVHHLVGNVGYAGLNLMVCPPGPLKIQTPTNEVLKVSRWSNFETERKNKFDGTSLHLSFTHKRFPLVLTDIDTIDHGVFYLQTVVSLWDNGKHLADIDMLGVERSEKDSLTRINLDCSCDQAQLLPGSGVIRCLDSWNDVLRPPRRMSIIRAHGNWSARLAAVNLLIQQQKGHTLGILSPEILCWRCLKTQFEDPEPHLPQILID